MKALIYASLGLTGRFQEACTTTERRQEATPAVSVFRRSGNEDDRRMGEQWKGIRKTVEESHTGFLGSGLDDFGWPARGLDTELLGL